MVSTFTSSPFNPRPSSPSNKMSITQTYMMAHKARAKLSREAAQPDHNLRLLVGHANLLDSLMLDLAEAEREQESWFNQSVRGASAKGEERHIQWADAIPEHSDEDWEADSSDSEDDSDDEDYDEDEDIDMADVVPLRRIPSNTIVPPSPRMELMDEDDFDASEDDEEDYDSLTLRRSPSHTAAASPPELDHDSDSSEDESMPPSPPFANLPTFSTKQRETTVTTAELYGDSKDDDEDEEDSKGDFYSQGFYLPPRRNPARLISAISVY
ncbi:hypothetical protein G7054_g5941 [Neopestalotiopsis clavispora]|jgi:hypothetical protein|nr:hypothetical protein G7054_g5941 [Neopestalotiopsis clavispora]